MCLQRAEQVDGGHVGKLCGAICQQKRGQRVLVRKLTSRSTDPVALFGVNVHSRGVDVFYTAVLLRLLRCEAEPKKTKTDTVALTFTSLNTSGSTFLHQNVFPPCYWTLVSSLLEILIVPVIYAPCSQR